MLTASRICFAITVALLTVVGILHLTATEEPPIGEAITVHDGDRDIGTLALGEHTIAFRITNASSLPLRVIGMHEAWHGNVCFGPKLHEQIPIPAHGEIQYECDLRIRKPGEFEVPLVVFFEDGGIRTINLTVRGIGK